MTSLAQSERPYVPGTVPSWALGRRHRHRACPLGATQGHGGCYREKTIKCWWGGGCHHPGPFVGLNWVLGMKKGDPGRARVEGGRRGRSPRVAAHTHPAKDFVAGERVHPEEHIDLSCAVQELKALGGQIEVRQAGASRVLRSDRARKDEAPS